MKIKELYHRFRSWQLNPLNYVRTDDKHICSNCGYEFEGEYCPTCGQYHETGHVTWDSVRREMLRAWGIDSKSIISSIIQLLGRPGYLISDYLNGRRQACYSPISMLFVIAMIGMMLLSITGNSPSETVLSADLGNEIYNKAAIWIWSNLGWSMLIVNVFMVFPTWLLFRFSPKHNHHTIPEGIYIQIFLASLVLIFTIAAKACSYLNLLFPIYYYFAYRQLFGYSIWGTIWRTALVIAEGSFALVILILCIIILFVEKNSFEDNDAIIAAIAIFVFFMAIIASVMYVGYIVGKKTGSKKTITSTSSSNNAIIDTI